MKTDTRRSFLKKGLFGSALLALGSLGALALQPRGRREGPSLEVLSPDEAWVVASLVPHFAPGRPAGHTVDEVVRAADTILSKSDPTAAKELKQLLAVLDNGLISLVFFDGGRRFSHLTHAAQAARLEAWRTSALALRRTGHRALRALVVGAAWADARMWPDTGYPGPPPGVWDAAAPRWRGDAP